MSHFADEETLALIAKLQATVQELTLHNGKLGREVKDIEAKNELLKQVEANLCELHNVALAEISLLQKQAAIEQALRGMSDYAVKLSAEQHKVKVLTDALEKCSTQLTRLGYSANHADEALAAVKGLK